MIETQMRTIVAILVRRTAKLNGCSQRLEAVLSRVVPSGIRALLAVLLLVSYVVHTAKVFSS